METLKRSLAYVCLLGTASLMTGCTGIKPLYHWGNYEDLIYQMYKNPGSAEAGTQIEKLKEDLAQANSNGLHVAPGLHAHLGYMYFLQHDTTSAMNEFSTEKKLFPESATFVDGLMGRIKK